ncbi:MAG TPA: GSU2403 family nucleotidyltransferase fold protein [Caulobacteraceae bacterium]|nr:GSU2403 family nucleotidyltransferase fold protein [Caulobacteraceae bacterium]
MAQIRELPLAIQTNYAELLDQLRIAQRATLGPDVTFRKKTIKGRDYWYARGPSEEGKRPERYLGADTPELRATIEAKIDAGKSADGRRLIVRSLIAAGLPAPDPTSGAVLKALAEAGAFRLRAVVVGTVAFQMYGGGLGAVFPGAVIRTGDLDIAQDYGVSGAVDDEVDRPMLEILRAANPAFRAVPAVESPLVAKAFALPSGFRVDLLTTNRGSERSASFLRSLRTDATPLRFLDFLMRDAIEAAALHDTGVLVKIPQPARYAIHKLLVARRRHIGSGKAPKDFMQATHLIEILARQDPFALREAYAEARGRGPAWRELLDQAVSLLPPTAREALA